MYVSMPPTIRNLMTKIELCREIFNVVCIIEPGISRTKGEYTLYVTYPVVT